MDYYEPKTGNKVHGKVMHKSDTEVHMKQTHDSYEPKKVGTVHKFKIKHSLDEVLSPSMGAKAYIDDFIKSKNPKFAGKSADKRRQMAIAAYMAAKKGMKEQVELDETVNKDGRVVTNKYSWGTMKTVHHGSDFSIPLHPEHHTEIAKLKDGQEHHFKDETGHHWGAYRRGDDVHFQSGDAHGSMKTKVPHHTMMSESKEKSYDPDHGEMVKQQLASIIDHAEKLHDMIEAEGENVEIPDWVHSKITLAQDYVETVHDFMEFASEDELKESWVLRQKKKEKKEESKKKTVKESTVKTYREFLEEIQEGKTIEVKPGLLRHIGSYGTSYQGDDEDDEDDYGHKTKPTKPADAPKRGRGRPAGSKSGAAGKTSQSSGKKSSGADYTGYKLHLPNSNK